MLQELAQTLEAGGHSVTVLTGFPNYPSGNIYPGYKIRPWLRERLSAVSVVRVPLYANHSRSAVKRILNYVSFAASSSVLGAFLIERPDVIFVYHPPLTIGLPAFILSRLWHAPFVYQIQDMWPETLRATGMVSNDRILNWIGHFAKFIYSKADAICVISRGFRENLIQKGVPATKIQLISNWVDPAANHPLQPDNELAARLMMDGRFNVMFAGNMGEAQGLDTVLKAASLLLDQTHIQFVFVGDGISSSKLQAIAREQGLVNVRFLGRFAEDQMPSLYALADVLLVHLKDDPLFRITIPHKIFTYMASGKPILAAVAGDAADIVVESGAGIPCPPQDPQALAQAVAQLAASSPDALRTMGAQGLLAARTIYSRTHLVEQIEKVLDGVITRATMRSDDFEAAT
jgi:glycosyltransferase involved in cell wall biosynthesis